MTKNMKSYTLIWLIALIVFNVATFVGSPVFNSSFWIGYVSITLSFILQYLVSLKALNTDNVKQMYYNLSLIAISYMGLVASLVVGTVCILIPTIPYWIGIIINIIVIALMAASVIKTDIAIEHAVKVEKSVKVSTAFMKELVSDAENLYSRNNNVLCKKVYEALRYSDPVSCEGVSLIEDDIRETFNQFKECIERDDSNSQLLLDKIIGLIDERNKKVKMLK